MTDTTAQIQAKGCQATGITEDMAVRLHDRLGKKVMAIVELEAVTRTETSEGKQKVGLRILTVEPATTQVGEDHLRDVQRALFMNRRLDDDQPTLDGDEPEPTVKDVIESRGQALLTRDDNGQVSGLWDGDTDDADDDDFLEGEDEDQADDDAAAEDPELDPDNDDVPDEPQLAGPGADDPSYDRHTFMPGTNDPTRCAYADCGKTTRARVHTEDTAPVFSS